MTDDTTRSDTFMTMRIHEHYFCFEGPTSYTTISKMYSLFVVLLVITDEYISLGLRASFAI
jgi:hypothetical protein